MNLITFLGLGQLTRNLIIHSKSLFKLDLISRHSSYGTTRNAVAQDTAGTNLRSKRRFGHQFFQSLIARLHFKLDPVRMGCSDASIDRAYKYISKFMSGRQILPSGFRPSFLLREKIMFHISRRITAMANRICGQIASSCELRAN